MLAEAWTFIRTWGAVVGLALDVVGAVLVFFGVYVSTLKAVALEEQVLQETVDDIGDPALEAKNEDLNRTRAFERLRASRWAAIGLLFFVVGFLCQLIASWPKS